MAGNTVEENFNPVGRTFSAASTLCCTPNSLAGGLKHFRRVAETPFNRIFEARR